MTGLAASSYIDMRVFDISLGCGNAVITCTFDNSE